MDEDTRELVRGLFVAITAIIEDAHEAAVDGQTASLDVVAAQAASAALVESARRIGTLAGAIAAITGQDDSG